MTWKSQLSCNRVVHLLQIKCAMLESSLESLLAIGVITYSGWNAGFTKNRRHYAEQSLELSMC